MIALPRVRVVARFGRRGSNLPRFVTASVLGHLLFVATLLLLPSFAGRTPIPVDSLVVDLVAAAAPGPAPAAEPSAPAEPPGGPRVATKPPPPAKPAEPRKKERDKSVEKQKKPPPPAKPAAAGLPGPASPTANPAGTSGDRSSSITPLETEGSELAWYREAVTAALYAQWVKPILEGIGEPYEVSVTFDVLRDGSLQNLRVEQSSGIPTFDRSAQRAVADAAPFPPLPPAWGKPRLSARFLFRLHPD